MAVETLTSPRSSLPNVYTDVTAAEIELAARFENNWDALRNIMGIMRPIRKTPGTVLKKYKVSVELEDNQATPGAVIPYSKVTYEQAGTEELSLEFYSKAATAQEIVEYGAELAIERSNTAFLNELQALVLTRFYTFLNDAEELTDTAATWQAALAKAKGLVVDKFNKMRKTVTEVVGFANVLDFYDYLGAADITVQTMFGLTYVQNFMGYSTLFLLSDPDVPRNKVFAVPVENITMYYADPADADLRKGRLEYTTGGGETNLIGFHIGGNYNTAVSETHALLGIVLWAEYLDGIANVDVEAESDGGNG